MRAQDRMSKSNTSCATGVGDGSLAISFSCCGFWGGRHRFFFLARLSQQEFVCGEIRAERRALVITTARLTPQVQNSLTHPSEVTRLASGHNVTWESADGRCYIVIKLPPTTTDEVSSSRN